MESLSFRFYILYLFSELSQKSQLSKKARIPITIYNSLTDVFLMWSSASVKDIKKLKIKWHIALHRTNVKDIHTHIQGWPPVKSEICSLCVFAGSKMYIYIFYVLWNQE